MEINIIESGRKKLTKAKFETYEHALMCFLHQWGILDGVKIDLYLDVKMSMFKDENSIFYGQEEILEFAGATLPIEDNHYAIFLNRKYMKSKIESEDELIDHVMDALAHEVVHVKQYYLNELSISEDNLNLLWKGEVIQGDINNVDLPHEEEAYGYADEMRFNYYMEKIDMIL